MADHDSQALQASTSGRSGSASKAKERQVCRFHGTKKGCKAGSECRFSHRPEGEEAAPSSSSTAPTDSAALASAPARDALPVRARPRPVNRPVPPVQTQDPRAFQIGQIQRRVKPQVSDQAGTFAFSMKPTDPDFPYDIDDLECILLVPSAWPLADTPSLRVVNKDIPRGFQINIERGFAALVANAPDATLLGLMNRLDRQLETILAGKMAETIKLVPNKGPAIDRRKPEPSMPVEKSKTQSSSRTINQTPPPAQTVTEADKVAAAQQRLTHTRQLEARFGRLPLFAKSTDGSTFTLPLDSPKKSRWPAPLQDLRQFRLYVSDDYSLAPATLLLDSESAEARAVEMAWKKYSLDVPDASLTQRINYLVQHIEAMASLEEHESQPIKANSPQPAVNTARDHSDDQIVATPKPTILDDERPHVQVIPRPPEWSQQNDDDDDDDDDDDESNSATEESEEEQDHHEHGDQDTQPTDGGSSAVVESGVLLSFPLMELHGIELLEIVSLDITIKCERCKDTMDVKKLRKYSGEASAMRNETCKKCARILYVGFRSDIVHENSIRAGYLDLDGCTVIDMLPSTFIPTCSECSTPYPAPGVVSVRGDSTLVVCRECHKKMTFVIPELKFLVVSASSMRASKAMTGRRKVKENLGITAGTELPRRGRCPHYGKSYRWFRFSCCSKVFPCDRCHDSQEGHPIEHANRMLCGFCSREQNFRPEDCGVCHATLIGKRGKGFWEGGKGTRDPMRMSRKDPRKYKRQPGTKKKD